MQERTFNCKESLVLWYSFTYLHDYTAKKKRVNYISVVFRLIYTRFLNVIIAVLPISYTNSEVN